MSPHDDVRTPAGKSPDYLFDSATELGREQLALLEQMLDEQTVHCLAEACVRPGDRCLDLGAGGGSVTRWLADRTQPGGSVTAVDLTTEHLVVRPGVTVYRHDIHDGLPDDGPYDLIHARLLLLHLPRRAEILRTLADGLAPGGRLVLGEFGARPNLVLAAPADGDAELFRRVQYLGHEVVSRGRGVSWEWAHEVAAHMADAGLCGIRARESSWTTTGGTPGCLLHRNYARQAAAMLYAEGLTQEEFDRYCELMLDPCFSAWFYQFVCTSGEKPPA
ncbi:methyltransferase domain-containing protein [Streptomyces sp. NPDC051940]|uniref:class I SAM-dependent methyltransferase n=1 Tax=Streptomyces sp. NPDC051940 TaxID=3155675 RepID=UPI00342096CD